MLVYSPDLKSTPRAILSGANLIDIEGSFNDDPEADKEAEEDDDSDESMERLLHGKSKHKNRNWPTRTSSQESNSTEDENFTESDDNDFVNRNEMNIILVNARSLRQKLFSLIDTMSELNTHIALVTETWLTSSPRLEQDLEDTYEKCYWIRLPAYAGIEVQMGEESR